MQSRPRVPPRGAGLVLCGRFQQAAPPAPPGFASCRDDLIGRPFAAGLKRGALGLYCMIVPMKPLRLCLLALLCAAALPARRLPIQVYTVANGMPRNSARCMVPDPT